jgi:hypothetical protein
MSTENFESAWLKGAKMNIKEAYEYALEHFNEG